MRLSCEDLSFSYGARPPKQIVRNLTMTLDPGERIALSGPSGCGKSTLLHLLAGLYPPTAGAVKGIPSQGVSMVFQESRLIPQLTALCQLKLVAPKAEDDRLLSLLAQVGLQGKGDLYPAQMSGGMQRRVAAARAAAFCSPFWLLDEPFSGLDEENRKLTARFFNRFIPKDGVMVAVLHSREEAKLLGARILPFETLAGK